MSGVEEILLAQVAKFRAGFARNVQMVVDDQPDVRAPRDGQNRLGHPADFVRRGFFGAELDQIRAAVAKLLRKDFRRAAMEIGRVNKSVKPAVRERFHKTSLITKHTKHTKEFAAPRNSRSIWTAVTSAPLSVRTKIIRLSKFFAPSTAPLKPAHSKRFAPKAASLRIVANITAFFQTPSARTSRCARRT
jgi:hypothetical protein